MASAYPGGLDTFATNKANATATTTDHPAHHNDLADAVNKIEAELGINPSGASATVAARFSAPLGHLMLEGSLTAAAGANDVLWDGNDVAGFTQINISGTHNLIEQDNMLSVKWWNQGGDNVGGLLKTHTFVAGDAWTVPVWLQCATQDHAIAGILIADGTASGSASLVGGLRHVGAGSQMQVEARRGTLGTTGTSSTFSVEVGTNRVFVKLTYVAANTFRVELSPDGLHFAPFQTDISFTLTPTHIGVGWMYGNSGETWGAVATYGPFRKVA